MVQPHRGSALGSEHHMGEYRARHRNTQAPGLDFSLDELRTQMFGSSDVAVGIRQRSSESHDDLALRSPRDRLRTQEVKYEMVQLAGDLDGHVQVTNLGEHGFTVEDLSRVIYDKLKNEDLPDFLDDIELERKGGLGRISQIWSTEKYFWFFFLIVSVLFNISYLLAMDWLIFSSFTKDIFMRLERLDLTNATQGYASFMESNAQTAEVFKHIEDPDTRWWLLYVAAVVTGWEVCWVFVKVLQSLYIWWLFCWDRSEYKCFHAIVYFFQKLLPQFSTFSAIKLMAKVHPSLIYNEYLYFVNESPWRATRLGFAVLSAYFFLKCAACAMAALGAFSIKVLALGTKLKNPECSVLYKLGGTAALMNQCMGCVIMEVVLQDRLFLFVFGGQDAMYEDRGIAYKNVYESRMAKQIWEEFWQKRRKLQALVLFATFDHYDLQKLLIEELPEDYNTLNLNLDLEAEDDQSDSGSLVPISEVAESDEGFFLPAFREDPHDPWCADPPPFKTSGGAFPRSRERDDRVQEKRSSPGGSVASIASRGMSSSSRSFRHEVDWHNTHTRWQG